MTTEEIRQRLLNGDMFSGRNGAFPGKMQVLGQNDKGLLVRCTNLNGTTWEETWDDDIKYTIWAFERGDYYFT